MEVRLSLKACVSKCEGQGPATVVEGKIERAHRHSPEGKVLALGHESVLITSRAMRLLLSGCTLHVKINGQVTEVKLAKGAEAGDSMRQRRPHSLTSTAEPVSAPTRRAA